MQAHVDGHHEEDRRQSDFQVTYLDSIYKRRLLLISLNMTYEGDAWASESSVDLGSDTVALVRMADVLEAVKEARNEQKTLLQQARDEQQMHTAKVLRVISDMMMLGVATLIVVIVLCMFVLYTKPPVNIMCDPVVNHKWEPPVNHTT